MLFKKQVAALGILAVPLVAFSEQSKVVKIFKPVFVTVDRRPEKDIKYSKCIGHFKTEKGESDTAAVAASEDRVCPSPEELVIDIEDARTLTDGGNTEVTNHIIPAEEFKRTYSFKGKDWQFGMQPKKVTVKVNSLGSPSSEMTDTFYIAAVWDKASNEKMWIATNKAGSITEVFENAFKSEKPLAIGSSDGTTIREASKVTHK